MLIGKIKEVFKSFKVLVLELILLNSELKTRIIFNSTNNNNYNFNSKYLFEYIINQKKDLEVKFIVNDSQKRKELSKKYGDYFIGNSNTEDIKYILKSKIWITSTIELPVFSSIKRKNRIIYHLGHGIPLKKIGMSEEKISFLRRINRKIRLRMFTHVLSYSKFMRSEMEKIFENVNIKYLYFGQPRNDSIEKNAKLLKNRNIKILYAPTWRNYDDTIFFPFEDLDIKELKKFLEENNIYLYLRKHPYYDAKIEREILDIKNVIWLNSDKQADITEILGDFDLLITDYSSVFFDFLCLKKGVIFIPYDLEKYKKFTGFSFDYNKMTPGPKVVTFKEFKAAIKEQLNNKNYEKEIENIIEILNLKNENNCKENYDYIINNFM